MVLWWTLDGMERVLLGFARHGMYVDITIIIILYKYDTVQRSSLVSLTLSVSIFYRVCGRVINYRLDSRYKVG